MIRAFFLATLLIVSGTASADWASGGGELVQDSQNPWFIQNTKSVTYCLKFDLAQFHQSSALAASSVERALDFWKREFLSGASIFSPRVEVATQTFTRIDCTPVEGYKADLVFQFGLLTPEQRQQIRNPSRFAGLAIREEYDRVQLKGRGFIYIGADSGPDRFQGENTVDSPWTVNEGGLLYWTLVHELGHVFGLSHSTQKGVRGHVMAGDFIETIMHPLYARGFRNESRLNPLFRLSGRSWPKQKWCSSDDRKVFKEFFGIESSWQCISFQLTANGFEVYAAPDNSDTETHIGTATSLEQRGYGLLSNALHFWLPPEQTVFAPTRNIKTPSYYIEDNVALYQSRDGRVRRQVSFTLDPRGSFPLMEDLKFGGYMNETLYVNLIEGT